MLRCRICILKPGCLGPQPNSDIYWLCELRLFVYPFCAQFSHLQNGDDTTYIYLKRADVKLYTFIHKYVNELIYYDT